MRTTISRPCRFECVFAFLSFHFRYYYGFILQLNSQSQLHTGCTIGSQFRSVFSVVVVVALTFQHNSQYIDFSHQHYTNKLPYESIREIVLNNACSLASISYECAVFYSLGNSKYIRKYKYNCTNTIKQLCFIVEAVRPDRLQINWFDRNRKTNTYLRVLKGPYSTI